MSRRAEYVSAQETKSRITREKLLNAAISLVDRSGMSSLTVRNVCDEAGLSTGSFYNLFSGKDELIAYYLKYAFGSYKTKAEDVSHNYNCIERCLLVYRFYTRCCKEAGLEFVSDLYASNNSPFFDFIHRDSEDEIVLDVVRANLQEGKEQGIVRDDVDIDEALLRIASIVTGLMFYWCVFQGAIDVEYEIEDTLRIYLRSLLTDPAMPMTLLPLQKQCDVLDSDKA